MRLDGRPFALALSLSLAGLLACRSAAPDLAPAHPESPSAAGAVDPPAPAALDEPAAVPAQEAAAPAGEAAPEDAAPEDAASEEEPASEAERIQKEALEACQSAEEQLGQGEVEAAIASVDRAYALMLELPANGDDAYLQAKEDIRMLASDLIGRAYRAARRAPAGVSRSWDLGLPITDNQHVQREIQSFTTVEREAFVESYARSALYRPMILERLEKAGLPRQLSWLPLVESGFKVRALSRASALGLWQFISSTGVRYGLNRDAWVDERMDPEKATDAAIAYLIDLHGMFGDWPKALAAYNCGEARVLRLSRPSSGEYLDFWDLYEVLPRETRRYVPRLFAALQIVENPGRYGMTLPEPAGPPPAVSRVRVERAVQLDPLDEALGLEPGGLVALNPELRRKATPPRAYDLRVPAGIEEAALAHLASAPEWKPPPPPRYATHRVRSGETLSVIARRYGTSVSAIMRANGLTSANRLRVGQRLRIPGRGAAAVAAREATETNGGKDRYRVRPGDTLARIAETRGVPLRALLDANGLGMRSTIYAGQWLVIP